MLALLFSVIVLSIQSPQTLSQPTKSENKVVKNSTGTDRKGAAKNDSKAALPPSNVQNIGVPSAPQKQETKDDEKDHTTDRVYKVDVVTPPSKPVDTPLFPRYLLLTGIGVVVTGVGVFVNGLIWFSILKQTKLNEIVAAAAKNSADAAKRSADAAVASERAWVMVELASYDLIVSDDGEEASLSLRIIYRNAGRTPAWITEGQIYFELVDLIPETPDFSDDGWYVEPKWLSNKRTEKRVLTWKGNPSADGSAKNRIIYGVIKYRDVLCDSRTTTFGYQFDMFDKPRIIDKYNENT